MILSKSCIHYKSKEDYILLHQDPKINKRKDNFFPQTNELKELTLKSMKMFF